MRKYRDIANTLLEEIEKPSRRFRVKYQDLLLDGGGVGKGNINSNSNLEGNNNNKDNSNNVNNKEKDKLLRINRSKRTSNN